MRLRLRLGFLSLGGALSTQAFAHAYSAADRLKALESNYERLSAELEQLKLRQIKERRAQEIELRMQREALEADPYRFSRGTESRFKNDATLSPSITRSVVAPVTAHTYFGALTDTPPAHPDLYGSLRRGQIQIGPVRVTLGGFAELAGFWRNAQTGSDQSTDWRSIPWRNSPYYRDSSFAISARHSRLAVLLESRITRDSVADIYAETDFQNSGTASNGRQTSSYTLRERALYGEIKDFKHGWFFLGGQNWSLVTANAKGMLARDENAPLTVDANYLPGFAFSRLPQLRIVKSWTPSDRVSYWAGFSLEAPSSNAPNAPPELPNAKITDRYGNGTGTNNSNTYYALSVAPDMVAKLAFDHKNFGHYEILGLGRFFKDRVDISNNTTYRRNYVRAGGGGGGTAIVPIGGRASFQLSALAGEGIGRYGAAQLADYSFSRNGAVVPLPELVTMTGLVYSPVQNWRLYGYLGAEKILGRRFFGLPSNGASPYHYGYGDPSADMSPCRAQSASTCLAQSNLEWIMQATGGAWFTAFKGDYGTVKLGMQYSHTRESSFKGAGGSAHTSADMVFTSLRYLPFE